MKKREAERIIHDRLEVALAPAGFRFARDRLRRDFDGGRHGIFLVTTDYRPMFVAELVGSIRIDAVEAIRAMVYTHYGEPGATLIVAPEEWPDVQAEYRGSKEEDFVRIGDAFGAIATAHILPIFDACRSVADADRLLNRDEDPGFSRINRSAHAETAVILAKLAGNPAFEEIATRKADSLARMLPSIRAEFDRLVEYLRGLPDPQPTMTANPSEETSR